MTITTTPERYRTMRLRQQPEILMVGGKERYVFEEQGRSVLGPVVHRRRSKLSRSKKEVPVEQEQATQVLDIGEKMSKILSFGQQEKPRRPWYRKVLDGFCNEDVHYAIKHTALDVLIWSLSLTAFAAGAKAIHWMWF